MKVKLKTSQKVIIVPLAVSFLLIFLAILLINDFSIVGNLIIISVLISTVPYFLYRYSRFAWIKALERQFPNFIRDLADAKRSGVTLVEAIHMTAKTHYGKLTPEIVKMSNRLSWGTPFLRVLDIFGERVKESVVINEILKIIKESYQSGGNIVYTLDSAARDINMLMEAEAERKSVTSQHVLIMYGIFFLFLGIVIMLINILVPMLGSGIGAIGTTMEITEMSNPCPEYSFIFPCGLFISMCSLLGLPTQTITCYYVSLFFFVLIIQGVFSGLIAGQLGENSLVAGTKHSLIMVFSVVFVFIFLARFGLFPA